MHGLTVHNKINNRIHKIDEKWVYFYSQFKKIIIYSISKHWLRTACVDSDCQALIAIQIILNK